MASKQNMKITLENLEEFVSPINEGYYRHVFSDENGNFAPEEHQDQIFRLSEKAAEFLWNYYMTLPLGCSQKNYKDVTTFDGRYEDIKVIRKYLYNLGIPFNQKVFMIIQRHDSYVLTWKMVIKYAHNLFDPPEVIIRDKTANWQLECEEGIFRFGKDLIYDGQLEMEKMNQQNEQRRKEKEERRRQAYLKKEEKKNGLDK